MNKKLANYLPLSKKELKELFQPYREAFPEWEVKHDVMLTRKHGPLVQSIFLEPLRAASYRPGHSLRPVFNIPDGCGLIHQWLDTKYQIVRRREHSTIWPLVIKAMEDQFLPSIRKPLDVVETLRVAEEAAERDRLDNPAYTIGLAVLNAYVGNAQRSIYWCERVEKSVQKWITESEVAPTKLPVPEWMARKRQYAVELQQAVKAGTAREFMSGA